MGRPPQDPAKARSNRVVTFVTDAEMEKINRLADEQGKALSAVVYELLATILNENSPPNTNQS